MRTLPFHCSWCSFAALSLLLFATNNPCEAETKELKALQEEAKEVIELAGGRIRSEDYQRIGQPVRTSYYVDFNTVLGRAANEHLLNSTQEALGVLQQFQEIKEIELSNCINLSDHSLELLKPLKGLEVLHLGNTNVNGKGFVHLRGCQKLSHLYMPNSPLNDAGLEELSKLNRLVVLDIKNTKIGDEGIAHLASLENLVTLDLAHTNITDTAIDTLIQLPKLTRLNFLGTKVSNEGLLKLQKNKPGCRLRYHFALGKDVDMEPLFPENSKLSMEEINVFLQAINPSWRVRNFKRRRIELYLSNSTLSDSTTVNLIKRIPYLDTVEIRNSLLGDQFLNGLGKTKHIERLTLVDSSISNDGLSHLNQLKKLHYLNLAETNIGDPGLKHLKNLTSLAWLRLHQTRVTPAGIEALKGQLPNCQIQY